MYKIFWKEKALKQLSKIHWHIASTIRDKAENYLSQEPRGNSKLLTGGHKGLWRYRVDDYRIFYEINEVEKTITIASIDHRSKAYQS